MMGFLRIYLVFYGICVFCKMIANPKDEIGLGIMAIILGIPLIIGLIYAAP